MFYINVPSSINQRNHFISKFNETFSAPEETYENFEKRLKAWEAINRVPDYSLPNVNEHFLYIRKTRTRFGNAIFEFISGLAIGRNLNRSVLFDVNFTALLRTFPNIKPYLHLAPIPISVGEIPLPIIKETGAGYFESWMYHAIPKEVDVCICCYFQSYKYFQGMEDEVRQMLKPSTTYVKKASMYMKMIAKRSRKRTKPKTFVGVHVRRGDMATRDAWKSGRLAGNAEYIRTAMNYYRTHFDNVHFIICSDDIHWCRANIKSGSDVSFSNSGDYRFDFVLLSQCDHSIMTVGTFGWWSSWLSNGTVVYYDYQNKPGSYFERRLRNDDFFPPTWIPMTRILDEQKQKQKKKKISRSQKPKWNTKTKLQKYHI